MKAGVRERVCAGRGAGARGLHAVRVVTVGGAVGQAAAGGARVGVAGWAAQRRRALAGVRVPAGAGARAAVHGAAVGAALRQPGARVARRRAGVRVRVLLVRAPRWLAVHHHVVPRRLEQPRASAATDRSSARRPPSHHPDNTETDQRKRHTKTTTAVSVSSVVGVEDVAVRRVSRKAVRLRQR